MKWIFEGSNLFAFICLLLGVVLGVFGYFMPDVAPEAVSSWQLIAYGFAAVLMVLGAGIYSYNFFSESSVGSKRVTQ